MLKERLSKITTKQLKAGISLLCFGVSIPLCIYIVNKEQELEAFIGCYDCGWDSRQAFLLVLASILLLINRIGSVVIALLASAKVIYSISQVAFWNNIAEIKPSQGYWLIFKESVKWTIEARPEYFVEIPLAILVAVYCVGFIWDYITSKISMKHNTA